MVDGIRSTGLNGVGTLRVVQSGAAARVSAGTSGPDPELESELGRTFNQSRILRRALERLKTDLKAPGAIGGAVATSSVEMNLNMSPTKAGQASREEVNTIATSYTPFGPSFSGASTSLATVGGVYTGTVDDTWTLKARNNRTVGGSQQIQFDLFNAAGTNLGRVTFAAFTPANTAVTIRDGVTLSLGAGTIRRDDRIQIAVSKTVGSRVDPDKPFNGTRNNKPNLQPGNTVGAGSFKVNGVNITVAANDTLKTVLARITASAAGVEARFDVASETVQLTQKTAGASHSITLSNDTSGFVAAAKLDGLGTAAGQDADPERALSTVARFAGVRAGTVVVGGKTIAIDPSVDSLEDVLARISGSGGGVRATLDATGDRITLSGQSNKSFNIASDGTGLLAAIGVSEGTYIGGGVGEERLIGLEKRLKTMSSALDALFRDPLGTKARTTTRAAVRTALLGAFRERLGGGDTSDTFDTKVGLRFDFREGSSTASFGPERAAKFRSAIRNDNRALANVFLRSSGSEQASLIDEMIRTLKKTEEAVVAQAGSVGVVLRATL